MDWETVRQLAPHYVAMLLVMTLVLTVQQAILPDLSFWVLLAIALLIGAGYPYALRALGIAPEPWQR